MKKSTRGISVMKSMQGIALVEVLVTALVLGVGLMGMAGLQMKSLQYNQASYLRSQANLLAYDVMDRMRLNRERARAGDYNQEYGAYSSGGTLARQDLRDWNTSLTSTLPGGQGRVNCSNTTCTVDVRWKESADDAQTDANQSGGTGEESWVVSSYSTRL